MSDKKNTKQQNTVVANKEIKTQKSANLATKSTASKNKKVEVQNGNKALDFVLWTISTILICGAIFGNFYYVNHYVIDESSLSRLLRVLLVIFAIIAGLAITLFTTKGKKILSFARESYVELRKVVWPTRQEAVQTTFIVFIAVCVVSLFLYLCDVVFLQVVRAITL